MLVFLLRYFPELAALTILVAYGIIMHMIGAGGMEFLWQWMIE